MNASAYIAWYVSFICNCQRLYNNTLNKWDYVTSNGSEFERMQKEAVVARACLSIFL
jgi:hypothetical protein